MQKLAVFILIILAVLMGLGLSAVTATAGEEVSNDLLIDANQAP